MPCRTLSDDRHREQSTGDPAYEIDHVIVEPCEAGHRACRRPAIVHRTLGRFLTAVAPAPLLKSRANYRIERRSEDAANKHRDREPQRPGERGRDEGDECGSRE